MTGLDTVSGFRIYQGDDGNLYVRLEAVARQVATAAPNTAAALLDFLLGLEDE